MKVGLSYWGFCEKFHNSTVSNTPDGHRYGRPVLVDALLARNHEVYSLQEKREAVPYPGMYYDYAGKEYPDIDVLFVEWRWPTYKNFGEKKFEPDLDRQTSLLDFYHGKIPIIVWDTDLKMTSYEERRWPEVIIADPSFEPRLLTRKRSRLTFWSDFKPLIETKSDLIEFGYIGNNYERDRMFSKYYSSPSRILRSSGTQTKVHGNWLQRSPERASPEELIKGHPNIAFGPRVSFQDSMKLLNNFICTVHITKPDYAKVGFASPRYLENIVVGTPALVPSEFKYSTLLGERWKVSSSEETAKLVSYLKSLSHEQRQDVVYEQRDSLLMYHDFSVDNVVNFIESLM